MLLSSVYGKTLRDWRRGLLGWGLGIGGYLVMAVGLWPAYSQDAEVLESLVAGMPEAVKAAFGITDLSTAVGYLEAQIFSFTLPLLLLVFGIAAGARAIAGDEESGSLELLLAHPVNRRRIVLERFAALATSVAVFSLLVFLILAASDSLLGLGVGVGPVAAISVSLGLLGLLFGTLALAAGAATGARSVAIAAAVTVAAVGWAADSFGPLIEGLDWLQRLSPFYYYDAARPLRDGLNAAHAVLLALLTAAALAAGLWRFERRDVGL
ncbi:MAG TPA: ABC transporter permease subunit [Egibacteraceae bacterium]|nr:ABC transporter permease subunit [Egibacteraceae bacterium]